MSREILVALQTGTDPVVPLPPAAFHRTLEEPIYCPKCQATYYLLADYDWVTSRHFEDDSRRHLAMLKKAIFLEHTTDHRTTHFESNGVVITRHRQPQSTIPDLQTLKPATKLIM